MERIRAGEFRIACSRTQLVGSGVGSGKLGEERSVDDDLKLQQTRLPYQRIHNWITTPWRSDNVASSLIETRPEPGTPSPRHDELGPAELWKREKRRSRLRVIAACWSSSSCSPRGRPSRRHTTSSSATSSRRQRLRSPHLEEPIAMPNAYEQAGMSLVRAMIGFVLGVAVGMPLGLLWSGHLHVRRDPRSGVEGVLYNPEHHLGPHYDSVVRIDPDGRVAMVAAIGVFFPMLFNAEAGARAVAEVPDQRRTMLRRQRPAVVHQSGAAFRRSRSWPRDCVSASATPGGW